MPISEKQKNDLRNRLQFAIVLALFFPVIFGAALKTGSDQADNFTIGWGVAIVVLIVNYFLIESLKNLSWKWVVSFSNLLLFTQIGSFAAVMYGLAGTQYFGTISDLAAVAIGTASLCAVVMPTILLLVLAANVLWPGTKETLREAREIWKYLKGRVAK